MKAIYWRAVMSSTLLCTAANKSKNTGNLITTAFFLALRITSTFIIAKKYQKTGEGSTSCRDKQDDRSIF